MDIPLGEHFVSIDEMLPYVGEFGKFQWMVQILFGIMQFPPTFPPLMMYFAALNPDWKCSAGSNNSYCSTNQTFTNRDRSRCEMPRSAWEFTKPKGYSIVTQFDIHCSNEYLIYLSTSICFAGMAFGSIAMGWLGDRFGRKKILFPSMFFLCFFSLVSAFVPNMTWFLVCRFVVGFLRSGTSVQMLIIVSELTGSKFRPLAGMSLRMILPIANCILGLQAYFITDWKMLFVVCSAPYFITIIFYRMVPESMRWLRLKGKSEEVMEVFHTIARWNNKAIPPNIKLSPLPSNIPVGKSGIFQLFQTGRRALSTTNLCFGWMVMSMIYYGISLAADDLGGSLYINFILVSLVEFPAGIVAVFLLNRFGRKKTIIFTMLVGSLCCIAVAVIPNNGHFKAASLTFGMLSKFFVTITFNSTYTWTVEIFPTSVRAEGMGLTQFASRIGAAGAPVAAKGLKHLHPMAPFLFMGLTSIVAAGLLGFLPETKGRPTRETVNHRPPIATIHRSNVK